MKKQDVKLESFLTVISPGQVVRIISDSEETEGSIDKATEFRGRAVETFREYAGKGILIKHVSPELERETDAPSPRYVMHIYIYK